MGSIGCKRFALLWIGIRNSFLLLNLLPVQITASIKIIEIIAGKITKGELFGLRWLYMPSHVHACKSCVSFPVNCVQSFYLTPWSNFAYCGRILHYVQTMTKTLLYCACKILDGLAIAVFLCFKNSHNGKSIRSYTAFCPLHTGGFPQVEANRSSCSPLTFI
jgi:hypothetical protein